MLVNMLHDMRIECNTPITRNQLVSTDSPQGKVRFGLPLHALRFYFPALWPEAEADLPF